MDRKWNWQQPGWPGFEWDQTRLAGLESEFLYQAGALFGAFGHLNADAQESLKVELISNEAITTTEIEGEYLNRDSLQSSIRKQFGLNEPIGKRIPAAEQGISEMMADLYRTFSEPLTKKTLFAWHRSLMKAADKVAIGQYRTHSDPMQIVSGYIHNPRVHFEAPPSERVAKEMARYITWFNASTDLPILTRAGIAHLYFESIHPFEDGNGRMGRALAQKALAQGFKKPSLIALSPVIQLNRKAYYSALQQASQTLDITDWLIWFAQTVLEARQITQTWVTFLIQKTKLYDRIGGKLNTRQQKVIARMFQEGPNGFKGGLSAENYIRITGATRATATRDLQDLVEKTALVRTGELRYTRYELNLVDREV